jgi:hypothetical protein
LNFFFLLTSIMYEFAINCWCEWRIWFICSLVLFIHFNYMDWTLVNFYSHGIFSPL